MVAVRAARSTDYEAVLALYRELMGENPVIEGANGERRFAEVLAHPGTTLFVAEEDGAVVSVATLHVLPNMTFGGKPYALVENVVTLARCQGRGLGTQVMEHLIEAAWGAGCYKIMLLTAQGYGARDFYAKLGFSDTDKHGMTLRRAPPRRPR
ncbi:MAG: GNAT family N-acetyltransferase [Pseudomonadota bacterium]